MGIPTLRVNVYWVRANAFDCYKSGNLDDNTLIYMYMYNITDQTSKIPSDLCCGVRNGLRYKLVNAYNDAICH